MYDNYGLPRKLSFARNDNGSFVHNYEPDTNIKLCVIPRKPNGLTWESITIMDCHANCRLLAMTLVFLFR